MLSVHAFGQIDFGTVKTKADSLFHDKEFAAAFQQYELLIKDGYNDPNLLINAANCASRSGDIANAIYYYETAMRYKSGDKELKKAIKAERSRISNTVIQIEPFFLKTWIHSFATVVKPGVWAFAAILMLVASIVLFLIKEEIIRSQKLKIPFNPYGLLVPFAVLLLIGFLDFSILHRRNEAVVFSNCDFREAPTIDSPLTRSLYPGEKVILVDEISGYYKVNLLNLDDGWIQKECVKIIGL